MSQKQLAATSYHVRHDFPSVADLSSRSEGKTVCSTLDGRHDGKLSIGTEACAQGDDCEDAKKGLSVIT